MADDSDDEQGSTGLLDLPPEIWSKICKLAVSHDFTIDVFLCYEHHNRRTKAIVDWCATGYDCIEYLRKGAVSRLVQPAITRVCRAIREECLSHFYKTNVFTVMRGKHEAARLAAWLDAIGAKNRSNLQYLTYKHYDPRFGFDCNDLLDKMEMSNSWTMQPGEWDLREAKALTPFKTYIFTEDDDERPLEFRFGSRLLVLNK